MLIKTAALALASLGLASTAMADGGSTYRQAQGPAPLHPHPTGQTVYSDTLYGGQSPHDGYHVYADTGPRTTYSSGGSSYYPGHSASHTYTYTHAAPAPVRTYSSRVVSRSYDTVYTQPVHTRVDCGQTVETRYVQAPTVRQVRYVQAAPAVRLTDFSSGGGVGAGIETGGFYGGGGTVIVGSGAPRFSGVLSSRASAFTFQSRQVRGGRRGGGMKGGCGGCGGH